MKQNNAISNSTIGLVGSEAISFSILVMWLIVLCSYHRRFCKLIHSGSFIGCAVYGVHAWRWEMFTYFTVQLFHPTQCMWRRLHRDEIVRTISAPPQCSQDSSHCIDQHMHRQMVPVGVTRYSIVDAQHRVTSLLWSCYRSAYNCISHLDSSKFSCQCY